jgi:N-acyl-phosphatidylethanolamine-hydrolysing phospholipase D
MGPSRFTQPPCAISSLPPIDIVLISQYFPILALLIVSSHYDHLDINTISSLGPNISYYVPLGNKEWFNSNFSTYKHVHEMDWWDEKAWKHPTDDKKMPLTIACTPCQHFSGRGLFDRNHTLWSSWTVLGSKKYFFGGYTHS